MFEVLLFYKYTPIDNPEGLRDQQRELCQRLEIKGRIIVAKEGINVTLEGTEENVGRYMTELQKDPRMKGIHFKTSDGTGNAFPKLSVKVRRAIVAWDLEEDINPNELSGKYIYAEELHDWIHSDKAEQDSHRQMPREFYIIDMRNDFEYGVGHFQGSIFSGMEHSKDLPKVLPKIMHLKDKTVVTICTGGVRCEKASGFLLKHGFKDVYQLFGGIVTYMEKYPNEDFHGLLYTFDQRLVMGFNVDDPKRVIVGRCANCNKPSENMINCLDPFCHRHFIACLECLDEKEAILCPMGCRDYSQEHPEAFSVS
jgi:UPF0176 protein